MDDLSVKEATGKIAFIFPAKYNLDGASAPTLNFISRYDGVVAMSVGISFLELDPKSPYFVILKLQNSQGEEVEISSGMNAIPPEQIDHKRKSSFLTASFYFKPESFGTHKFTCDLIHLGGTSAPVDSKDVLFNVIDFGE